MKCHYCVNEAVKHLVWLKNRKQEPARIVLPWCGCDLMTVLKKFWPAPYPVREGVDYEVTPLAGSPGVIPLNEYGMAVWRHRTNKNLFVERSYDWCDRVIVLDETITRNVVDDTKFTTFDFTNWIPVTVEEFKRVKANFKEIYDVVDPV